MTVLFIKHIDIEGPGTIADFLESNNVPHRTINPFKGDTYPDDPKTCSAIVSLGGPMNVYEEEKYPFLKLEDSFLRDAVRKEVPILGICLGAQLLAKACGAKVEKAKAKEIGWYKIPLTSKGKKDPLFRGIDNELNVFQWHGDTFNIPDGGVRLAESNICPNQAFRYGKNAYGIQFHVEVTKQMIQEWIEAYKGELDTLKGIVYPKKLIKESDVNGEAYNQQASQFFSNFFRLAGGLR
ncbi:MAG TPA: type 1 glutamine amidotransferase [Candidatus Brocadiia bacterium]|nr:type 1 glutamine amidotransferase [Planctomycetota bacterium]MBI4008335.1 type 1 glutamine amidotransferase [Planctomycetota bacterium]MDO8093308.1 type 1 glutamine amidotransferase [Candidatus Brocadiales bacterium]